MARALAIAGRDEKPAVQQVSSRIGEPGPGEVRVAVEAASVNGIDAAVAAGLLWDMMPHEFPVVIGRDFAGLVDGVGAGVSSPAVGDRVTGVITGMALGPGAIAEAVVVDAALLAPVPAAVSAAQAAAVGLAAVTAYDLVSALQLGSDDVVLVAGATGGVGSYAVQLAAASGATVLGTARPGPDTDHVLGLGAAHAVDHTGDLAAAVRSIAPDGVTAVVHSAGDAGPLAALLRPGGRLASALGATPEAVGRDDVAVTAVMATAPTDKVASLLDSVATGAITVPIARTYAFDQAEQAVTDFSGHKLGKIVVTVR
jgi:NADPH:quinone reductase-like Zn-dependent oxidoreductase